MQLTPRDAEMNYLLAQHRFLRSNRIITLAGRSPQQLLLGFQ
jgi:hypothetical protein